MLMLVNINLRMPSHCGLLCDVMRLRVPLTCHDAVDSEGLQRPTAVWVDPVRVRRLPQVLVLLTRLLIHS